MNFLQAVTELEEGRCKGIKLGDAEYKRGAECIVNISSGHGIRLHCHSFLSTDWQLVDPVPQYEDVEVVRYVVIQPDGTETWYGTYAPGITEGEKIVELTGNIRREVKPKVKRREVLKTIMLNGNNLYYLNPDQHKHIPINATYIAEWEE